MKCNFVISSENDIAKRLYPKVIHFLKNHNKGRLLDVGTGQGNLAYRLKLLGFEVYTCDVIKRLEWEGLNWKKVDIDKEGLPYPNESFDYVTITEVIEHLENPRRALREVARVLKRGGYAVISTPHILSMPQRLFFGLTGKFLHFQYPYEKYGHISPFSLNQIKDELKNTNLKLKKYTFDRGFIPLLRIQIPPNFWFGDLCIIKVKKI